MRREAESGLINLILVKDVSRLGRDHIEVDHYVEDVFPGLGVRFIALMDNIDSEGNADILPFRSLLNNYYLKDLSRKIKSVLYAKAEVGEYVGAFAPYGYKKDSANKGRLVVDAYAAEIVRRIYEMRLQRMGHRKIAAALNEESILAPRAYCYVSEGKENPYKTISIWRDVTVKLILQNETYLGHSVKMKKGTLSYKRKTLVNRSPEDWIRTENTHDAIISQDVWDAVQGVDLKRYSPSQRKTPELSLFAGLIFCDNGHPMSCNAAVKHYPGGVKTYRSYLCSLYKQTGGAECSWHTISELALLQVVRDDMQKQLERIDVDEDRVVWEIQSSLSALTMEDTKKELQRLSAKLAALDDRAARLYEDRLNGAINLDTFMALSAGVETECTDTAAEHERLSRAVDTAERQMLDIQQWISDLRSYLSLETPDRCLLRELIERVEVGEGEGKGKSRCQNVKIIYRFVGFVG